MANFTMHGKLGPEPTFDRIIRRQGQPPADRKKSESDYYMTEVTEVVPLGVALCTHDDSCPAEVLDVMERHAIETRNRQPGALRQGPGEKGQAIAKRPKSAVLLMIYGA
eukprot:7384553-Prymnesium_polylepis.1